MKIAIVHYTAPPVVGGVEAVIQAHARVFRDNGYQVAVVAGRGGKRELPEGTEYIQIPKLDGLHPDISQASECLETGEIPENFAFLTANLEEILTPVLSKFNVVIVHNVLTKHFNLPLTAALVRLLDHGSIRKCIAWCHDFTWTSPNSRSKVFEGYPWDLLRMYQPGIQYVVVSKERQRQLARLYGRPEEDIHVVYNGVSPKGLLGFSEEGEKLIDRLGLMGSDLNVLMPVRVTQAKNIELALNVVAVLKSKGIRLKLILTGPPDPHDEKSMNYFQGLQETRKQLDIEDEMRFVFESGDYPSQGYTVDERVVGDLYRVCDLMFMPSHREGFGMPVLEAGLIGIPVFTTEVPAAVEIGGNDVLFFKPGDQAEEIARTILKWAENDNVYKMRRKIRERFTWGAVFERDILPLLEGIEKG
jgi:glycosyltransferase involved in cell wall biosynthesis